MLELLRLFDVRRGCCSLQFMLIVHGRLRAGMLDLHCQLRSELFHLRGQCRAVQLVFHHRELRAIGLLELLGLTRRDADVVYDTGNVVAWLLLVPGLGSRSAYLFIANLCFGYGSAANAGSKCRTVSYR